MGSLAPLQRELLPGFVIMRLKFHKYYCGDARAPWTADITRAITYQHFEVADETADTLAELGYSVRIEDAWLTAHGTAALSGC